MSKKYLIDKTTLTDIADAIREKTGGTATIIADDFPDKIRAIDTSENLDAEIQEQKEKIAELESILAEKAAAAGGNNLISINIQGSSLGAGGRIYYVNESYEWIIQAWRDTDIINIRAIGGMIFCEGDTDIESVENGVIINDAQFSDYVHLGMEIAICHKDGSLVKLSGERVEEEIPI